MRKHFDVDVKLLTLIREVLGSILLSVCILGEGVPSSYLLCPFRSWGTKWVPEPGHLVTEGRFTCFESWKAGRKEVLNWSELFHILFEGHH